MLVSILISCLLLAISVKAQVCICRGQFSSSYKTKCTSNPAAGLTCQNATYSNVGHCNEGAGWFICSFKEKCLDQSTCTSSWTRWLHHTTCFLNCTRKVKRTCYLNDGLANRTRSTDCENSGGRSRIFYTIGCSEGSCRLRRATTMSTLTTTTKSTTKTTNSSTTVPNTSSGYLKGQSTFRNEMTSDRSMPAPRPFLSQEMVVLISVLGSVAMLCLAMLGIAFIVLRRPPKSGSEASTVPPVPSVVGMTLPPVPSSPYEMANEERHQAANERRTSEPANREIVTNRLYETIELNKQQQEQPTGNNDLLTTTDGYLRPISSFPQIPESFYASAVDNPDRQGDRGVAV